MVEKCADLEPKAKSQAKWPSWVLLMLIAGLISAYWWAIINSPYRSKHLNMVAEPIIGALRSSGAESITCHSGGRLKVWVEGVGHDLRHRGEVNLCPVLPHLEVTADGIAEISPRLGVDPLDFGRMEDHFKSKSVEFRREQFALIAKLVGEFGESAKQEKLRQLAEERKATTEREVARASWDALNH